ncbi:LOW QUALITY PROTEIN: mRNA-capping enzyme [Atheta coriaria]|uniref:LOW QUALITY PROTEIN: mRNA-capping enzyme n=1 Tax=Dalotia coriaria TaxID=877792 RepID=UPI0031F388B8
MSKYGKRGPGPVPNRWLRCPRKSNGVIINKFLAFKAPLSEEFNEQVPQEYRFHPEMLIDICKSKKIKLGLWIDLTNTKRFYKESSVKEADITYMKMPCRGHGETPSKEQTEDFINVVSTFIEQHPLHSIGVHCTHGFNRTGFLIVSYLVEKEDCSLPIALQMFAKVRPPGIYKKDYLEELYARYDDPEDTPPPPILPDWCYEEDEEKSTDNDSFPSFDMPNSSNNSGVSSSSQPPKNNIRNSNAKRVQFMEGVPGVYHFTEQPKAHALQRQVQAMCGWKSKGFPGSQPISMDVDNIKLLSQKPYRVSWKADGMRYMMLIDGENDIYFFDRDHNIFFVEGIRFPRRKDLHAHLKNTLIDGEMVIDKVQGESIPRYLAYDIIKFESQDVGKMAFYPIRLHCLENEIIKPRYAAMEQGIINKASEPFSIRHKQFWDLTQAGSLLGQKFAATLSHEPDGLIFQPSKEPYVAGRCDDVLKWKPLDMNSVDFRLKIVKIEGTGIVSKKVGHLFVGKRDGPFASMKYTKELKDLDGKIIECKFEDQQWKFMRERTDKSFPNSVTTAEAVCGSILHPVTKESLLNYIARHKFEDDSKMMPPPSKKVRR